MAVLNLDGYPQADGAKWESVADVTGPTSYVTGGFSLAAVSLGMAQIDHAVGGIDSTGVYRFEVKAGSASDVPSATVTVMAFLISSAAQVTAATNLSAIHFRIRAIGI